MPRFAFEKFPQADDRLTTQMKSVGEVMAIGRTFQESLQKALRGLEVGVDGFNLKTVDMETLEDELGDPRRRAHLVRGRRVRRTAVSWTRCTASRSIDPWFLGADQGARRHSSSSSTKKTLDDFDARRALRS